MNRGIPYAIGLCCLWPLAVHFGIVLLQRGITQRDWTRIRDIRWPWGKHD